VSGPNQEVLHHALRPRKLAPEQEAAIRASAGDRSLRSLAGECGVSHQTVHAPLLTVGVADVGGWLVVE
jgi:hypothetical protein